MHTTALHSRFTNCAPNARVLTSQGSWIEIENIIQAFLLPEAALKISLFPGLATQLPEMHPFSDIFSILSSFNTTLSILIPCLLVLFSLDVLHTL